MKIVSALVAIALAACAATSQPRLASDAVIDAATAAPLTQAAEAGHWNVPFAPFNIIGNLYYVGTNDLGSFLIVTPRGDVLIDGGLPQSAPQIIANIQALGFDIHDVKYVLNTHAHYDHAGGLAALQRASGAIVVAGLEDRATLEAGEIGYGPSAHVAFPPVRVDHPVRDGDQITLGGVTLTAHHTPGHTAGCTSWSFPVIDADGVRHTAFVHGSATVAGQTLVPESYPGMIADFRATFARVRTLHADVFLGAHAGFYDLQAKRARQLAGDANAFVDPEGLQHFNIALENAFNAELTRQQAAAH